MSDKIRIFGDAAAIDDVENTVLPADIGNGPSIGHADRLAATRVVGHSQDDGADIPGAVLYDQFIQFFRVHIALEWVFGIVII